MSRNLIMKKLCCVTVCALLALVTGVAVEPAAGTVAGGVASSGEARLAFFVHVFYGQMRHVPRLLNRLHHEDNYYVTHLDAKAAGTKAERHYQDMFEEQRGRWPNVADLRPSRRVAYDGVSMVELTLSAVTLLLGMGPWSYLITLSPHDYPLLPQPQMRAALGSLPPHLNFVSHASAAWDESGRWWSLSRVPAVVLDRNLYMSNAEDAIVQAKGNRTIMPLFREFPTAFDVYRGEPWVILDRLFAEYLILGTDGWARRALLYMANFPTPIEHYFPTVLCNSQTFRPLVIRDSLRNFFQSDEEASEVALGPLDVTALASAGHLMAVLPGDKVAERSYDALDEYLDGITNAGKGSVALGRVSARLRFVMNNNATCDFT